MRLVKAAGVGLVLGTIWGVVARVWMHFLTDEPVFTWAGTLSILVLTALTGAALAVVRAARLSGRTRWWRVLAVPTLVLFASPGMLFLPAYVVGGVAASGRGARWLRVVLFLAVAGWTGLMLVRIVTSEDTPGVVIPTLGWLAGSVTMVLAGSVPWRRWPRRSTSTWQLEAGVAGTSAHGRSTTAAGGEAVGSIR